MSVNMRLTNAVEFVVSGEPMSKERPRHSRGRTYTPARTQAAEARILAAWLQCKQRRMFYGDVHIAIHFDSATRVRRDLDNLCKLCLDSLNGHAYADDSQVQRLVAERMYVPKGQARTVITITEPALS